MKSHDTLHFSRTLQSKDDLKYLAPRQKEISGIFARSLFLISDKCKTKVLRTNGARFFNHIKTEDTPTAFQKSRLFMQ